MVAWPWIIGIAAVVWPVIIALYLDRDFAEHLNKVSEASFSARYRTDEMRQEISKLQAMLEKQDALIAALWQKTFGFHRGDAYDGSKLPEYLGIKPEWHPFERDWAGPVVYLTRYDAYPWGTQAENLFFPDQISGERS